MLSYEQFNTIFIVGLVLAGFFLVLSAVLFFAFRIPQVLGYLTGSTAKKAIAEIESGTRTVTVKSGKKNADKTKATEKASNTAQMGRQKKASEFRGTTTASLKDVPSQKTTRPSRSADQTALLGTPEQSEQTMLLNSDETVIADSQQDETTVADTGFTEQTTVLTEETSVLYSNPNDEQSFSVRVEITLFTSNEIIT